MNKPLCEVNNDLITIVVEEGIRTTKIRVWGCFHFGNKENKKDFDRYFENMEKGMNFSLTILKSFSNVQPSYTFCNLSTSLMFSIISKVSKSFNIILFDIVLVILYLSFSPSCR